METTLTAAIVDTQGHLTADRIKTCVVRQRRKRRELAGDVA
jgi:hypothetical protein